MGRGERRDKTRAVVLRRCAMGYVLWELDHKQRSHPHRLSKEKVRFFARHGSAKWLKRKANRGFRRGSRLDIIASREPMQRQHNSLRWEY